MATLLFVIGCATGGVASQLVVPPVRAGTDPTRWEHFCTTADTKTFDEKLKKFGPNGWEMVSVVGARYTLLLGSHTADNYALCFKRPLQ